MVNTGPYMTTFCRYSTGEKEILYLSEEVKLELHS
jgi:hypothetical protein